MKCDSCGKNFRESWIEDSHDVPCYLFYDEVGRKAKKNKADSFGRHWLCKNCHKSYEFSLNLYLKKKALEFAKGYFK